MQKSESLAQAACWREATLGSMMDWAFGSNGPKPSATWESSRHVLTPVPSACVASGGVRGHWVPGPAPAHWQPLAQVCVQSIVSTGHRLPAVSSQRSTSTSGSHSSFPRPPGSCSYLISLPPGSHPSTAPCFPALLPGSCPSWLPRCAVLPRCVVQRTWASSTVAPSRWGPPRCSSGSEYAECPGDPPKLPWTNSSGQALGRSQDAAVAEQTQLPGLQHWFDESRGHQNGHAARPLRVCHRP